MRRLDEATMLDRMVSEGGVSVAQIRAIAARLAAFHRAAAGDQGWKYGSAAAIWRLVRGNLEELASDRADTIAPAELDELERFVQSRIESRWSLFNRRALGSAYARATATCAASMSRSPTTRSRSSTASSSTRACATSTSPRTWGFLRWISIASALGDSPTNWWERIAKLRATRIFRC